jgi:excisionase family DNA binding protein
VTPRADRPVERWREESRPAPPRRGDDDRWRREVERQLRELRDDRDRLREEVDCLLRLVDRDLTVPKGASAGRASVIELPTPVGRRDSVAHNRLTVSVPEAAELLGVSERHLRRLIREGEIDLPVHHIGRRQVISRAALEQFLAEGGLDA